jgi:hypothetical protein
LLLALTCAGPNTRTKSGTASPSSGRNS